MIDNRDFDINKLGEFGKYWLPHPDVSDIWQFQGQLWEPDFPEAIYSFRLSISKFIYPFESFYVIQYSLGETLNDINHHERMIIPILRGKKAHISFDKDSLFIGDAIQVLNTDKAYVLSLRGKSFGLDLRLDKSIPLVWFGEDGKISLTKTNKEKHTVSGCSRSRLHTYGRVYFGGKDLHVEGTAALERLWGNIPLKTASHQWEKFYLFFNNQDELMLVNFPFSPHKEGTFISLRGNPLRVNSFDIEPMDYIEIDEWRFASIWQIDIPKINKGPYYLIPLIKKQYSLPVPRPFVGIYDKEGVNQGYGHAELMPGARNELSRIHLNVYKRQLIE